MHAMPPPLPLAVPPRSSLIIDFRPSGTVEAMHQDAFNLSFLGKQDIRRASDIRFDESAQTWTIWLAEGDGFVEVPQARGFESYEEARRMEVRWLNHSRLHEVSPTSVEGLALLNVLRHQFA